MRKGTCSLCQDETWVNRCSLGDVVIGEYCADCFEHIDHDEAPRKARRGGSSGLNHNDPGIDDVIRVMEEDR